MSSRQEEKERRKQERLERERAEQAKAKRLRLVQVTVGALLAVAAIAAVAVAVTSGGSGESTADGGDPRSESEGPPPPPVRERNLDAAVKKAGCELRTFESEGAEHTTEAVDYKSNPPHSGGHNPVPAEDGSYVGVEAPATSPTVHSLEHGRINYQYAPGTPARRVGQLEQMVFEDFRGASGYHSLVFENRTRMPYAVAATAWTRVLGCERFTDASFDALRAFREQYVDKAPEFVP